MYEQGLTFEPGVTRDLLVHCETYTITRLRIQCGVSPSYHSHENAQAVYILDGSGIFRVGKNYFPLTKGDTMQISPCVRHGFQSVSKTVEMLEFFVPAREDIAQYHLRKNPQPTVVNSDGMEEHL